MSAGDTTSKVVKISCCKRKRLKSWVRNTEMWELLHHSQIQSRGLLWGRLGLQPSFRLGCLCVRGRHGSTFPFIGSLLHCTQVLQRKIGEAKSDWVSTLEVPLGPISRSNFSCKWIISVNYMQVVVGMPIPKNIPLKEATIEGNDSVVTVTNEAEYVGPENAPQ